MGKAAGIGRGCKWLFSGPRLGHLSGYQPELTDYKLDTRNWTLVDVESDRYVGDAPCETCHWFLRSAPMWIEAESTVVFHTCRSGDEVWTLIPKEPSLCPLDVGGDAYDTDGLGRGCMNMYSFHVRCVRTQQQAEGFITRLNLPCMQCPVPPPDSPACPPCPRSHAGYYVWAGRGSHGGAGLGTFKYLLIEVSTRKLFRLE